MTEQQEALERAYAVQIQAELIDQESDVKALAAKVGISYSAMRNYLFLGPIRRSMPLSTLLAVTAALGVPLATLDERARQRL